MSNERENGDKVVSIIGAISQLPNAIASGMRLDRISSVVNSVTGYAKGGVFGAVSLAMSDNRLATALGIVAGAAASAAAGAVAVAMAAPAVAVGVSAVVVGVGVSTGMEHVARTYGIGVDDSEPSTSGNSPSSGNVPDASEFDLSGSSPNPADQQAGYNRHNTPGGAGSGSDGGNEPDLSGYDLSGDSPNPADQDAGYNRHNTPSGAGSGSDGGNEPDLSGYDLSGDSPNPADQDAGYNRHNTPGGAGGWSDSGGRMAGGRMVGMDPICRDTTSPETAPIRRTRTPGTTATTLRVDRAVTEEEEAAAASRYSSIWTAMVWSWSSWRTRLRSTTFTGPGTGTT